MFGRFRTVNAATVDKKRNDFSDDRAGGPAMSLYAYKLKQFFLNGWIDAKTMLDELVVINEDDEYLDTWRERIAERLDQASVLLLELGWQDEPSSDEEEAGTLLRSVLFAPLPVADGPLAESEFMIGVWNEHETFVVSPFELPWLAAEALDFRRSETVH